MPENTHGEEIGSASGCKSHLDASRWAPEISDKFGHLFSPRKALFGSNKQGVPEADVQFNMQHTVVLLRVYRPVRMEPMGPSAHRNPNH